jgi:hypothetical protein
VAKSGSARPFGAATVDTAAPPTTNAVIRSRSACGLRPDWLARCGYPVPDRLCTIFPSDPIRIPTIGFPARFVRDK